MWVSLRVRRWWVGDRGWWASRKEDLQLRCKFYGAGEHELRIFELLVRRECDSVRALGVRRNGGGVGMLPRAASIRIYELYM